MKGLDSITPEFAQDLIKLVNKLKGLPKKEDVEYNVQRKDGSWAKKQFKYVSLDDILEKIKEDNNFAFMQPIGFDKESNQVGVKCILVHKSGKCLESDIFPIKTQTPRIQDEGAEITYRKRYAVSAFFGLATEDDTDGNVAGEITPQLPQVPQYQPMQQVPQGMADMSKLLADFEQLVIATNSDRESIYTFYGVQNNTQLNYNQLMQINTALKNKLQTMDRKKEEVF